MIYDIHLYIYSFFIYYECAVCHILINEYIYTLATREPYSLCTGSGKRPDGVTQVPWSRGRCLAWDANCRDTFAVSHVLASSRTTRAGSEAATAEAMKSQKYITTAITGTLHIVRKVKEKSVYIYAYIIHLLHSAYVSLILC